MLTFLSFLETKNKLTHLNVSWNSLKVVKKRQNENGEVVSMNAQESTRFMCSFVKRQTRLQHLDLSNTHLSERSMHYLIKRLAKNTSLNSIHLSD